MKTEISAGGVIVRPGTSDWEVLLLKDMNGNWTFPKGMIEPGEPLSRTAVREIQEEVGLSQLRMITELPVIHYYYKRENKLIYKTVHYFLFQTEGDEHPVPQTEEGISEILWMPLSQAIDRVGYPETNRGILNLAAQKLKHI